MDAIGLFKELLDVAADRDMAGVVANKSKPEEFAGQADQESAYARGHHAALSWAAQMAQKYLRDDA